MQLLQKIKPHDWENIPELVNFHADLPKNPYCTDQKGVCHPRNKPHAIKHGYIQPNHPAVIKWLVFDIDTPNALFAYHDNNLPRPQFIVRNPNNGHAHYCYRLTEPVGMWGKSSVKAIEYLRAVYNALATALGADKGYSGNLIKNPYSSQHETYITGAKPSYITGAKPSYTLAELADFLDLTAPKDPTPQNDDFFGRNCTLFHTVRKTAYRIADHYSEQQLYRELLILLEKNNLTFDTRLHYNELKHIAKSITRYCKSPRFKAKQAQYNAKFSQLQAQRGSKGGKVSKRPPIANSEATLKPWEQMGISRITYYRRKKKNDTG